MATRLDVAPFAKSDVYALNRRIRSVQAEIDVIDHRLVGEEFQFGPLRSLRDEKVGSGSICRVGGLTAEDPLN